MDSYLKLKAAYYELAKKYSKLLGEYLRTDVGFNKFLNEEMSEYTELNINKVLDELED